MEFQIDGAEKGLVAISNKMHLQAVKGKPRELLFYYHAGERVLENLKEQETLRINQIEEYFQKSEDIDQVTHLEGQLSKSEENLCVYAALTHNHREEAQTLFEIARARRHAKPKDYNYGEAA